MIIQSGQTVPGRVFLVGAGPGDPGLLTRKAWKRLRQADVVVYDRLVHPELLTLAPRHAELIPVGKRPGAGPGQQKRIHRLLAERALAGLRVVRLKGGDPLLFGRGGEEAEYLLELGIPVEIIPGVSSALAAAAALSIPLTQRGLSSSVAFVTGHQLLGAAQPVRFDLLARSAQTLVVLMCRQNLPAIVEQLLAANLNPETPAALVEWATWPQQRQIVSPVSEIAGQADRTGISSPCVLVIGPTVAVGKRLLELAQSLGSQKDQETGKIPRLERTIDHENSPPLAPNLETAAGRPVE